MTMRIPCLLGLALSLFAATASAFASSIVDGVLVGKTAGGRSTYTPTGKYTSQLQTYIDAAYKPVPGPGGEWSTHSWINATNMRSLQLTGDYLADVPLRLPSLFVLKLDGTMRPAPNISLNVSRFTGMVELKNVRYSAVVGGRYDATGLPMPLPEGSRGWQSIAVVGSTHCAVRGVRALANNSGAAIGITAGGHVEVSFCDVGADNGGPRTNGRAIWSLATSHNIVHDNHIHNSTKHSLDFDAYTGTSVAYNNLCEYCSQEGIFVEESAHDNFIFNNTCANNGNGIGLYSNAVGPVTNNKVIGNVLRDNLGTGISAGGYGHSDPHHKGLTASVANTFASNVFINNGGGNHDGQANVHHGETSGDLWTSNTFESSAGVPSYTQWEEHNSSATVIFDPS